MEQRLDYEKEVKLAWNVQGKKIWDRVYIRVGVCNARLRPILIDKL